MKIYEMVIKYKAVGTRKGKSIASAEDIVEYMNGSFDSEPLQEQFWVILLNGNNEPMCRKLLTLGLVNQSQVHAREAFRFACIEGAVGVIFAHNHPSGNLMESKADIEMTKNLVEAGKILNITVLDHVIFADDNYNSIRAKYPNIF